ncbi:MAG TPA: hypothetical protein VKY19_29500 [Ktedonosporobacter sp.]|jgi:photosystem II stability/assembly factor-like uncharacterized protein|nr:hypothetical protein [Ktedonosporobacter sp.]
MNTYFAAKYRGLSTANRFITFRASTPPDALKLVPTKRRQSRFIALILLVLFFTACSGLNADNTTSTTPTAARVNGFGTAANHVHSLLAFPNNVLVLATHYGLFRSADNGATWTLVAAGPGQLMDGLMTYSLVNSPLNPQRLYVLTQAVTSSHKGTIGLYTSGDQGRTWQMSIAASSLTPSANIYLAAAGNDTPDEVYVYVPDLGALGLKISMDGGQHFTTIGTLPFGTLTSLLPLPDAPGQILAASSDGLARSSDGGAHWQLIKGITGGIFGLVTPGPRQPIYASGDAGIYSSTDGGKTFSLVSAQAAYNSLTVSPVDPTTIYGKTASGVYRSTDGGHTWSMLPSIKGTLGNLVVNPTNPSQVYLSLSYPTEVFRFDQDSAKWSSLTPR